MDFGLSLVCAIAQTSIQEGRDTLYWKADSVTMDLVNCSLEQYACLQKQCAGGKGVLQDWGGQTCDHG